MHGMQGSVLIGEAAQSLVLKAFLDACPSLYAGSLSPEILTCFSHLQLGISLEFSALPPSNDGEHQAPPIPATWHARIVYLGSPFLWASIGMRA